MLTVLAVGNWSADQVRVVHDGADRQVVPDIERLIEQAWQRRLQQPNVKLFDGPMVRLDRFDLVDGLTLHLGETSYKPFVGTNMAHPELVERFGRAVMANPVGVSPLLITADRKLLFGHRLPTLAYYPNRIHPFAGAMDPKDASPFDAIRRELREELSLSELRDLRLTGIVEDHQLRQWELIFAAECDRTCAELIEAVDADEHQGTLAIDATASAVSQLLDQENRLTPVARATMLLWGRLHWGDAWFDRTIRQSTIDNRQSQS